MSLYTLLKHTGAKFLLSTKNAAGETVEIDPVVSETNRYIVLAGSDSPTDIETMTWTAADNVRSIRFKVTVNATATAGVVGDTIRVTFDSSPVDDSSDTTQAAVRLAAPTASETLDVENYDLICGGILGTNTGYISPWSRWFTFSDPLRRADFLAAVDKHYDIKAEVR